MTTPENPKSPVAIVQQQASTPAPILSSEDEMFEALEKRNRLLERILSYAISATHKEQWTKLGDKPWPTGPACEAMARRCAVSWDDVQSEKRTGEDERGKFYTWTYSARFRIGRDEITAEGHCSSRDQFLGTGTGEGEDAKRQLYEVEEGNIRQAAYTNMVVNGVTRILGVRNLSWERLEALLGVKKDDVAGAKFEAGARGGGRGKVDSEKPIPFGRSKGKTLSEAADDDLAWLLSKMKEPASDPKFQKSNDEWVKRIEGEQARRANAKAGVAGAGAQQGGAAPTVWARIQALAEAKNVSTEDLTAVVKDATGKVKASALVDDDVVKVQAALVEWRKQNGIDEDIKF